MEPAVPLDRSPVDALEGCGTEAGEAGKPGRAVGVPLDRSPVDALEGCGTEAGEAGEPGPAVGIPELEPWVAAPEPGVAATESGIAEPGGTAPDPS